MKPEEVRDNIENVDTGQSHHGHRYIAQFLSLKCAGDVLNTVGHVNKYEKEITEAMGILNILRKMTLQEKMKYTVYDLCAGNGLLGVLVAHILPVKYVTAIDIRKRKMNLDNITRYQYLNKDIYSDSLNFSNPAIVCAIHPCRGLSERIIDLYLKYESIQKLILMPCCIKNQFDLPAVPSYIRNKLKKDDLWVWHLANRVQGNIRQDKNIQSPKNRIIIAEKTTTPGISFVLLKWAKEHPEGIFEGD